MYIEEFPIDQIIVSGERRQSCDVEELKHSIDTVGLLNPITISQDNHLISGWHRLEACKSLGRKSIQAIMVDLTGLKAELAEIDENLVRNPLTRLERCEQIKRRKIIYEELNPTAPTKAGRHPKSDGNTETISSFSEDTASKIGATPRTVQQDLQIASSIDPQVKNLIRDTEIADSKSTLLLMSRLQPDEQENMAQRLINGDFKMTKRESKDNAANPNLADINALRSIVDQHSEKLSKLCQLLENTPKSGELNEQLNDLSERIEMCEGKLNALPRYE